MARNIWIYEFNTEPSTVLLNVPGKFMGRSEESGKAEKHFKTSSGQMIFVHSQSSGPRQCTVVLFDTEPTWLWRQWSAVMKFLRQ
jgi:hypothetical protein